MTFAVPVVAKPFPEYKWRWMEFTPVESFNRVDVLLGVTRAILKCVGQRASSEAFNDEMALIQKDLFDHPHDPKLANADRSRNLIRRQGRYWRGLGILSANNTELELTDFGRKFASGEVNPDDFIEHIIDNHRLPNVAIDKPKTIEAWQGAELSIAPLKILLAVLVELGKQDPDEAYLTTEEIGRVIVPLTLHDQDPTYLSRGIIAFRENPAPFSTLPDCVTAANDWRMLREHLLFFAYGGVLSNAGGTPAKKERFFLPTNRLSAALSINQKATRQIDRAPPPFTIEMVEETIHEIKTVERVKRNVEVVSRPTQAQFRRAVLANCGWKCVVTGENYPGVLIACHIHEVWENGPDHISNGIILRSDLHALFDSQKMRIAANGLISLAPDVAASPTYSQLPDRADLPNNLNREALRRRYLYGKVTE